MSILEVCLRMGMTVCRAKPTTDQLRAAREYSKIAYKEERKREILSQQKEWREINRDKVLAQRRNFYIENKDRLLARKREIYLERKQEQS